MTNEENIKGLSETIESQKQTIDAVLKKHAALQELNNELVGALESIASMDVRDCSQLLSNPPTNAGLYFAQVTARDAIAKAKGQEQ